MRRIILSGWDVYESETIINRIALRCDGEYAGFSARAVAVGGFNTGRMVYHIIADREIVSDFILIGEADEIYAKGSEDLAVCSRWMNEHTVCRVFESRDSDVGKNVNRKDIVWKYILKHWKNDVAN